MVVAVWAAFVAPARAEPVDVTSFDGTNISAEFTRATGLAAGERAPVMMLTHGFGLTREQTETSSPTTAQSATSTCGTVTALSVLREQRRDAGGDPKAAPRVEPRSSRDQ